MYETLMIMFGFIGVCFVIAFIALFFMVRNAEPFPYDDEDW